MNTPLLVILGIAALLAIMYFFGGGANGGSGCSSGKCHKKVRFNDQMGGGCSGDICGI